MSRASRHGSQLRNTAAFTKSEFSRSTSSSWLPDEYPTRTGDLSGGSESQIRVGDLTGGGALGLGRFLAISDPWSASWYVSGRRSVYTTHTRAIVHLTHIAAHDITRLNSRFGSISPPSLTMLPSCAASRYVSLDGACWTHMLLWMATDLAWTQCWLWSSFTFAAIGCCLSASLILRYLTARQWVAAASELGLGLWLAGGTVWMYSECLGDDTAWTEYGEMVARYIYTAVLAVFALLFICHVFQRRRCCHPHFFSDGQRTSTLNHMSIPDTKLGSEAASQANVSVNSHIPALPTDTNGTLISVSDADDLRPRSWMLCVFSDWAAYEDFHSLCWILVDLSWNYFVLYFWWPVYVLTFVVALDLLIVSLRVRRGIIDSAHYAFQIIWLLSSLIWVVGDFYIGDSPPSEIISLFSPSENAAFDYRFWSSVVCAFSLLLGVAFHVYWAYYSWRLSKKLQR